MPKLWSFRDSQTGATVEEPPENPWLRPPQGIHEQLQQAEAMDELRAQHRNEFVDQLDREALAICIDPPPAVRAELERILAVEGLAPPWLGLRRRVSEELNLMQDQLWRQLAREAEGARAAPVAAADGSRPAGGHVTALAAWVRRHVKEGDK